MRKPRIGEIVEITGPTVHDVGTDAGKVLAVFDPPLETWWDGYGEDKMGLMDYLEENPEIAERAEWYVVCETSVDETVALASSEVIVR